MVSLPVGVTAAELRREIEDRIDGYQADDTRTLQVLGAAVIREHRRLFDLEQALSGTISAHTVSEAVKYIRDLRHEVARAKGHMQNRADLIARWQKKLADLNPQEEGEVTHM
jgi:anti-sigma-K factor RskA